MVLSGIKRPRGRINNLSMNFFFKDQGFKEKLKEKGKTETKGTCSKR
jgi:hypothetical protein